MIKVTIDRFEGEYAVVELPNRETLNMPKQLVPAEAKEGEILKIEIDRSEVAERKREIKNLINEVWKK
jgi:hypothetical protein